MASGMGIGRTHAFLFLVSLSTLGCGFGCSAGRRTAGMPEESLAATRCAPAGGYVDYAAVPADPRGLGASYFFALKPISEQYDNGAFCAIYPQANQVRELFDNVCGTPGAQRDALSALNLCFYISDAAEETCDGPLATAAQWNAGLAAIRMLPLLTELHLAELCDATACGRQSNLAQACERARSDREALLSSRPTSNASLSASETSAFEACAIDYYF